MACSLNDNPINLANNNLPRRDIQGFSLDALNNMEYKHSGGYINAVVTCEYVFPTSLSQIGSNNNIPILSFNIRSMKANFNTLVAELLHGQSKFGVIGVCETKMTNDTENLYQIPNYKLFTNNVSSNMGGVCMYVHDTIGCNLISKFSIITEYIESLFLEVIINRKPTIIGIIYHRPGTSLPLFQEKLTDILSNIHTNCVLMGDININLLNEPVDQSVKSFVNNMSEFSYVPIITKPTRVQNNTATLLDHMWVNFEQSEDNYHSQIVLCGISDHFPTIFYYNKAKLDRSKKLITFRKSSDLIDNQFKNALDSSNIDDVLLINNVDHAFETYHNILYNLYDEYYTLTHKYIDTHKVNRPWITAAIKESIKRKNKLYKKFVKYPITYGNLYRSYRNHLTKIIKLSKENHYRTKFEDCKGNVRETWKNINKILGKDVNTNKVFKINNEFVDNEKLIANAFNNYYSNVGYETARSLARSNTSFESYLPNVLYDDCVVEPVTIAEVKRIIVESKTTTPGPDQIPMSLYKKNIEKLCPIVTHLCNLSLNAGTFPSMHKVGNIKPLYKKKNRDDITNYRPICLLNSVSKLLEKVVSIRLIRHLDQFDILSENQYAYRKGRSTELAAAKLIHDIINNFEENKFTLAVFLDLSRAFDCVNHDILCKKLEYYGIRNSLLDWFRSYLLDRKYFVTFNTTRSNEMTSNIGVPQGSILGPLLFLLYVNDFCRINTSCNKLLFADDSTLYDSHRDFNTFLRHINRDLEQSSQWFLANGLAINIVKCEAMVFSRRLLYFPLSPVIFQEIPLSYNYSFKYLGLHIDFKLNWREHINKIQTKLSRACGILYHIRNKLTRSISRTIYLSLAYPYLSYCNSLWASCSPSILQPLFITQKRIIRLILKKNRFHASSPLFIKLRLLKLFDINNFCTAMFVYKSILNLIPSPIEFTLRQVQNYNLRNVAPLVVPFARSSQMKRFLHIRGATLWNSLPFAIRNSLTIFAFKRKLKDFYIIQYT